MSLYAINKSRSESRKENDLYPTPPDFTRALLDRVEFSPSIWEPAAGTGVMADVLRERGYKVIESDLFPQRDDQEQLDFIGPTSKARGCDIITNPPFKHTLLFVENMCEMTIRKAAMVLPIMSLGGINRYERLWSEFPPALVLLNPYFMTIDGLGDGDIMSAFYHVWVVYDREYEGPTHFDWIWPPVKTYKPSDHLQL